MAPTFDLAIIGAGPGGYVAAIRASQLGMNTAIIEREHLGGICLNWGCIPTKALLRTSDLYTAMRRASEFGLAADNVRFDLARVVERSRKVAEWLSNGIAYLMRKNKVTVIDGTASLKGNGAIAVTGKDGQRFPNVEAKHIIIATGARARTLPGLEPVVVDEWCRTGAPGLYAIGDVVGPPWLAHKASHEGVLCVEKIAGVEGVHPLNKTAIPACTYSSPQVASVGLTEEEARASGRELKIGRFPYSANGKAIALGETEGLVKTVFHAQSGALIGAHIFGAEATELIQGFVIAKTLETTEAELIAAIFPHPTLSEIMGESVLDAFGRALHI